MIKGSKQTILRAITITILIIILGGIYKLKNSNASRYANTSLPTTDRNILRLVDYGSKSCKCAPKPEQFEELEKKYQGIIFFEYVDVFTATKDGIKETPTQVIYDSKYKELARNEGNSKEDNIIKLIESVIAKY